MLSHHEQIEAAFAKVKSAADATAQRAAEKQLATLLTGHSVAEEAVLYPTLVKTDKKAHSTMAYTEQSAAKVEMGLLEDLEPMTQDYLDKLEHIRGAVAHRVYEEEGTWFPQLKAKLSVTAQTKLTFRYVEKFRRYMGDVDRQMPGAQAFAREDVEVNTRGEFR